MIFILGTGDGIAWNGDERGTGGELERNWKGTERTKKREENLNH